ncbi:MAG: two-component system nitrogen regulation sensor histidine kinase GlnL [Litorivivens sp.]|jgi:two-component system nitrogen regulation sensor histidine kinase GlnL
MNEDIINHLNICILELDDQLRLLFLNAAAEHLLEVSGNQARDQHIGDIFQIANELESILLEALITQQTFTGRKIKFELVSGHVITCDYFITPVRIKEGSTVLIELYPLDRYLKIDRDQNISNQQLVTRQMIRGLAHEIKNPLGGIRGSAQLLERELPTDELRAYTEIIIVETDRLTALVDRLLGPNSLPKPSITNIHEVLERVRTLIELESKPHLEIRADYDPSIPEVSIDAELMVQVVLNIARNAMQAVKDNKCQSLAFVTRVDRLFTIGATQHRLVAKIDIIDNGPGIPVELRDHLFYPMITGRSDGTGLGLSVAQSIVHQHQGRIEFESRPGNTVFSIFLPLES